MDRPAKAIFTDAVPVRRRLPRNSVRAVHNALHNFTEMIRSELESAIINAKSRRLNVARSIVEVIRYLLYRMNEVDQAQSNLIPAPSNFPIGPHLSIGLGQLDQEKLQQSLAAWSAALELLIGFEGKQFDRKPLLIGRSEELIKRSAGDELDEENKALALLQLEATSLLTVFRNATMALEQRLASSSGKRNSPISTIGSTLSPPEVAKVLGVAPEKVRKWIKENHLRATNVASAAATRPRWRIDSKELEAFKKRQQPLQPQAGTGRLRQKQYGKVKEYF